MEPYFLKTHTIDPVSHSNTRSVFKVPAILLNGLTAELGNVSATLDDDTARYNLVGGARNLINKIRLNVNGDELDRNWNLPQTNLINGVTNVESSETTNYHQAKYSNRLTYNFQITQLNGTDLDYPEHVANIESDACNVNVTVNDIPLRDVLSVFRTELNIEGRKVDMLPLNLLGKNSQIELEIEWETSPAVYCNNTSATLTSIQRPYLILDEVVNPQIQQVIMQSAMNGGLAWSFKQWQVERVNLGTANSYNDRLNLFIGKYVNNLALLNVNTSGLQNATNTTSSEALDDEKIQLVVNNKMLIDSYGCDSESRKVMFYNGSWGNYYCVQGAQGIVLETVSQSGLFSSDDSIDIYNNLSLFGVNINERVQDLQLQLENTSSDNIRVYVVGEVMRGVNVNANGQFVLTQ